MCGILAIFGYCQAPTVAELRDKVHQLSKRQRHRGPDWSGIEVIDKHIVLAHERLAIMGTSSGAQPLKSKESDCVLTVNGEIYNYLSLRKELESSHDFLTHSDCEVIIHLYEEMGEKVASKLNGIFSFVLYDGKDYMAARDPIGVNPLYQGWHKDGSVWFASEMKCLADECERIISFPPGHYYSSKNKEYVRYYEPLWYSPDFVPTCPAALKVLRESFESSVARQMMTEVPFGVLLSGGLDSSLIASITKNRLAEKSPNVQLPTFSIGLEGAPDLKFAHKVASYLDTKHYEFNFTIQEGLDMIPDVIYHLETYDVTTIRASIPMFLLSRQIKALGIKMVLSGEGSDEIFGGYLYFHNAPDPVEFHRECASRIKNLHLADCLRANKSTMAWGVEVRVPFLDVDFLDVAMTIRPGDKQCSPDRIEKFILRQAFDVSVAGKSYLPDEILWRQKEQFSDGVGYAWIDSLRAFTETHVAHARFAASKDIFPVDTPMSMEAFYYRDIFERLFPGAAALSTVKHWIPRTDWGCSADPSGRAQKAHSSTTVQL